jgi:Fic family protein
MGYNPKFRITNNITTGLTKIERARGFLDATELSESWIVALQERALILEAHHTTHIEGTRLSLEDSEKLFHGKEISGADPDDVKELLNYKEAFELVSDYLNAGEQITEGLIREIHKRLVRNVRGDKGAPGEYRKIQNYVANSKTGKVIYTPPPPESVTLLMNDFITWIREEKDVHPVLLSGIAQFNLVHIHPFVDGNGRTARLLSTLILYQKGYDFKRLFSISEFYDRNRPEYYNAIQGVRESNLDLTGWLEYFVDGLATQMREIQLKGEVVIKQDILLARAREEGLKERIVSVLDFFLKQKKGTLTECEQSLGENRRTIQRDIKMLISKNFLREISSGPTDPTKYYEPSYDKL